LEEAGIRGATRLATPVQFHPFVAVSDNGMQTGTFEDLARGAAIAAELDAQLPRGSEDKLAELRKRLDLLRPSLELTSVGRRILERAVKAVPPGSGKAPRPEPPSIVVTAIVTEAGAKPAAIVVFGRAPSRIYEEGDALVDENGVVHSVLRVKKIAQGTVTFVRDGQEFTHELKGE
jgi:hypothetical protein